MKRTKLWLRIRESFWFLPSIYGVAAIIAVAITMGIDLSFPKGALKSALPHFLIADRTIAKEIFSDLITSILTMTTVTFSTIMVVLTTVTSQFSPRALQNFIADRITQLVLALFVAGVTYNLFALLAMRPSSEKLFITPIVAVLTGAMCIAAFVYFINHVSKWVQVNNLINKLGNETLETIHRVYQNLAQLQNRSGEEGEGDFSKSEGKKNTIESDNGGYVGLVDYSTMVNMAQKDGLHIAMHVHVGDFIMAGTNIMSYSGAEGVAEQKYRALVKLDTERTDVQDIEFGIQKLVEIALRAISPSVNDPHTAINCLNRIGTLLFELAKGNHRSSYLFDQNGEARVRILQFDFDHYLYKALYQIRYYASDDVSVTTSMIYVLKLIAAQSPSVHKSIREFAQAVYDGFDHRVLLEVDETYLQKELDELKEITDGPTE